MSPSYFAPSFTIEINGSGLAADISKYIQQVAVTSESNSMDSVSLTVANPYPEMRWTHRQEDVNLFAIGNGITIKMGYVDEEQPMFAGDITSVSAQFPEGGAPALNVQGHNRLHRLTRRRRSQTFRERTDKQIVETMADEHGLTAEVADTEATRIVHPDVTQPNQTDLEFLLERARRINFELLVEDRTLIFRPAQSDDSPVAVLEWGKNLRNFSPTMNARGQVNQVTVRGYDPVAKREIVGQFIAPGGGGQSGAEVAQQAFGSGEEERGNQPIASQEEADQRAQAIYNERARRFLTGSGATIGLPVLRLGKVVELRGLGLFNGTYRLTRVTHTIGSGGYDTSFSGEWFAL